MGKTITKKNIFDEESVRKKYFEISEKYELLAKNLKGALDLFLKESNINYLTVYYRIKAVNSFIKKIYRKSYYDNPFEQCEDICGLRIIYYYQSDIEKISKIIKREFEVLEFQDKLDYIGADQFGYRSFHFIVKIKKSWLGAPNYRGLENLKAEIQVCTVLMHAWDEIEHELEYRQDAHVPKQFKRKFSRISAKLEEADEQFEELRNQREKYKEDLIQNAKMEKGIFNKSLVLNLDNLQAFLDFHFPDRIRDMRDTRSLLDEMIKCKITMKDIIEYYEIIKDILPKIENEEKQTFPKFRNNDKLLWAQGGAMRTILDLCNDRYFQGRCQPDLPIPDNILKLITKWRKKL